MNMITAFSILLQLHGILLILVLLILLDFTYLVVLVIASLKSNLEKTLKHAHALERNIFPTLSGWPSCTCLYNKFSYHLGGIPAKLRDCYMEESWPG